MPTDGEPLLNVNNNLENTPPDKTQRLSRSPHPYHRQDSLLHQNSGDIIHQSPGSLFAPTTTVQDPNNSQSRHTYFDADHRKRREPSSPPSDSGTEADDEREGVLLGLPAPPNRLRKGLKGASSSGTASPLLTPSYLDREPRRLILRAQSGRRTSLHSQTCTDEETVKLRKKFTRRRRAELIRRTSETILIGVVGFIACRCDTGSLAASDVSGVLRSTNILEQFGLGHLRLAPLGHAAVIMTLYALYPLRIIFKNQALNLSTNRSRFNIHIPAAFEPAPLLYPVLLPVFVGSSLSNTVSSSLLPNLVLSVASIPSRIIPFNTNVPWYSSAQWLLSSAPILASRWLHLDYHQSRPRTRLYESYRLDEEEMLLLYPLHQALLPILGYLTTTSLLPAELQLLSVSMINLLLHARSPQAVILQCLLWTGGLSIFVFCGKVLTWEVALARIPSWRFRKSRGKAQEKNALLSAINDCFNGRLSKRGSTSTRLSDSDGSESGEPKKSKIHMRQKSQNMLNVDTRRTGTIGGDTFVQLPQHPSVPAAKLVEQSRTLDLNGNIEAFGLNLSKERKRRYTLPSSIGSPLSSPSTSTLMRSKMTQSQNLKSWSLRSFTKAQAIVLKGGLALYVYAVTIAVIAFVVRTYVGRNALQGQEPVGWALGYLLGDISAFRDLTTDWGLDDWIHLPRHASSHSSTGTQNLGNLHSYFTAANIRLSICAYCLLIIALGLAVVFRLSVVAEVDTRRKVFHGMMVAMFLPTIFIDPTFVSLAFILILAIFLLLDLFRASQLPPLSRPLTYFLAPYVDGRDHRGPVIVSHIFLLIGCAIPLWLSLAAIERTGEWPWEGWDVQRREVSMISGVVCVGMGDAAASLVGRRYGRCRWCWSGGKSLEGSLAFAVAVTFGLCLARLWLLTGGWDSNSGDSWATTLGKTFLAASGASLTEAILTGGNDNVIVPIILWLLVRGLRI